MNKQDNFAVPNTKEKAEICLKCDKPVCKGYCEKFIEDKRRVKKQNGENKNR